ncbi:hypothetical protein ABZ023_18580 [Streptomyces sp. NPDC006367]|uniref:hypothetical protein n=1 Tax=unclassified Streptomyces TaxID=2593676 RepID=UPI0033ADB467
MNRFTYPRTAATIADNARMALAAYTAVPKRTAAHDLHRGIHDMWGFTHFARCNGDGPQWDDLSQHILATLQAIGATGKGQDVGRPAVIESATRLAERFEKTAGIARPAAAPTLPGDAK